MNLSVVSKNKENLVLRIKDVGAGYVNSLRRIAMSEVPVLAIEDVEFRKNSGVLYDEIIAHRLGLVVLSTDLKSYNLPSECKCKGAGCAQCQVKLTLKVSGPKTVYAEDLVSKDPAVKPVFGKTVITKLLEGQDLELVATAVLGRGVDHSKWNACLAYYKEFPYVNIKKQPENAKELASKYSFVLDFKGGKLSVNEKEIPNYDVFEEIVASSNGSIQLDYKDDYLFFIESWQQLSPSEILTEAVNRLNIDLEAVKKLIKDI